MITRPEPGLSETVNQVQTLGWKALSLPLMKIKPLEVTFTPLDNIQAILFTSRQAVSSSVDQFIRQKIDYRFLPAFTVGDITAKDTLNAGFMEVISAHKDAEALSILIQQKLSPSDGKLLFPVGKGQGRSLISVLRQKKFEIIDKEVYEVFSVDHFNHYFMAKLQEKEIVSILFFSSQTAQYFINLLNDDLLALLRSVQAIAISAKVGKVLGKIMWKQIKIASTPTTKAMLSLMPLR